MYHFGIEPGNYFNFKRMISDFQNIAAKAANSICRHTNDKSYLSDIQSEIMLACLEGKISTIDDAYKFAWNLHKNYCRMKFVDLDINVFTRQEASGKRICQYYDITLVKPIYRLRASGLRLIDIAEQLNISQAWVSYNILNTIHLPIVSTKLKNEVLQAAKKNESTRVLKFINNNRKRSGEKHHVARLNEKAVREMRALNVAGQSINSLAAVYKVNPHTAYCAIKKETWKHI